MVSLTNIASVSTAVSDALKLSTKPTDLYDPKNPSAEAAAKYTLSSMADVVNTAEKYYNPNVDKEIATIVKISKEAQLNNIPETTSADRGFINGDFLITHKAAVQGSAGRSNQEQEALYDPWGVAVYNDVIAAVRSPVDDHVTFLGDNLTSFERIRAESQYGTVNKNFALQQFRVSERTVDLDKRYDYLIQHSGNFRTNLVPTDDELSVGVTKVIELRSDFNIYSNFNNTVNSQKIVTTKYRIGLSVENEIRYGGILEQVTSKGYIGKEGIDINYSQTVLLRQTSAYIGLKYNKIETTVSRDSILYAGVGVEDNSPEYIQFSSKREKDSVTQLNTPGTSEISTTYHLSTSKLVQLEKNKNVSDGIFAIKVIDSSERLVSVSNSDNGIKAASDASLSSRLSFDNSSDIKTLRAQTGKNAAVLQYNPITETGYYTIGGGGISIYPGLTQPMYGSTPTLIPYVSKSFKKMDIPSIYASSGDVRINGDSRYSLRLDVNLKNTTNYSKASGDSSSLFITPYGAQNGALVQSGRIFLNVIGNIEPKIFSTGPYGESIVGMGSQGVFYLTSFSPRGSGANPNDFYGLSTSNGRGPFHIMNNKLYSYKQGTLDQNKYFRITV